MKKFKKRVFTPTLLIKRISLAGLYLPFLIRGYLFPTTSRQLREKVMLAVTSVNDCRYCAWGHTHLALNQGIDREEINAILEHTNYKTALEDEVAALLYAQHYADTNGSIEKGSKSSLGKYFRKSQIWEIQAYINAIYIGNLSGNTFDALISRFKGVKVEGSTFIFEVLCSLITAPVLIPIMLKAHQDKKVTMDAL